MSINTERSMATSAAIEALTGVCAIVLSILALSNVFPMMLTSVAAIAVGFAFLIQGVAISSHYYDVLNAVTFTGAVSTEFIGGIGVLTLGILSLINITPMVLLPVAALVLGGIMELSSGETAHLSSLRVSENEEVRRISSRAMKGATGAQLLVGFAAITLGIIALTGGVGNTLLLSTIAILSVGVVEFSKSSALSAKLVSILRNE